MSKENWQKGYKEVKNVIHNDIGLTKEEINDVFRKIAKEEIGNLVSLKSDFIYLVLRQVIREEMVKAVSEHRYPRVSGNMFSYGMNGKGENSFKDYISGVMKEEITNELRKQFDISLNIDKKI
ncbi:hypothetical protein P4V41_07875 [Fictibacillus nanhaiensis]|uniref:hypothetical protein n=1 Tax=Fictibacillus nanhaiensis TaxID=742169 RepID=UPI002E20DBFD|nr:hypothetical protein [Fictibacillus nanhaiensis]